jgi:peptide/nickel transport system substrate-binding protein
MCPEQGQGLPVDSRSDVYSLGVVFYEMITGRKPFQADTPLAVVVKHMTEPLPRPKKFIPDLPDGVEAVIFKALAKNPDDRYTDMSAFQNALEKLGRGIFPVETPPKKETTPPHPLPTTPIAGETQALKTPPQPVVTTQAVEPIGTPPSPPVLQTQSVASSLKSSPIIAEAVREDVSRAAPLPLRAAMKPRSLPVWLYLLGGAGILGICGLLIYAGIYFFQRRGIATVTPQVSEVVAQGTQTLLPQTRAPLDTASSTVTSAVEITSTLFSTAGFSSGDVNILNVAKITPPNTLDPAFCYMGENIGIIANIYETLVFPNPLDPMELLPMLADSWEISADGLTYTFHIREGVSFQNGNELTAEDVAYSLQRGILQANSGSGQGILLEPLVGRGIQDVSLLVDPTGALVDNRESLKAADADTLRSACLRLKQAISANDASGTVTFFLAEPFNPFLSILAAPYTAIMDKDWSIDKGGWDGSCETWQNFYAPTVFEDEPFYANANGTGPFSLDRWDHQTGQIFLARNERYWLKEPLWAGGPSGPAAFSRVIISYIEDPNTRLALMQSGGADLADLSDINTGLEPLIGELCSSTPLNRSLSCEQTGDQPIRQVGPVPTYSYFALFFNFSPQPTSDGTALIGSGKLDGNGIPPDFFSDVHIRRAFAYCIDYNAVIQQGFGGNGFPLISFSLPGSAGYDPNAPHYEFDLEKCAQEFRSSEWPDLWNTGFYLRAAARNISTLSTFLLEDLSANLAQVNSRFILEPLLVDMNTFRDYRSRGCLPILTGSWAVDYFDTYQFYTALIDFYPQWQNIPNGFYLGADQMLQSAAGETDAVARDDLYKQLNLWMFENVPAVPVMQMGQTSYQQRWMDGIMLSSLLTGDPYFYSYWKH